MNLRIRALRKERGLTVAELAEMVSISVPHMSGVERGIKNLNNHLLERIAEALSVHPSDLITSEEMAQASRVTKLMASLSIEDQDRVRAFAAALAQTKQD